MSIIGQPIMAGGGGVTANIKVMGDVSANDTICRAALGSKTINGTFVSGTTPYWNIKGIKDYGTWTVTWSNGTVTHTRSVTVDVITEYTVENIERLYLYNEGDECTDETGGWSSGYRFDTNSYHVNTGSATKNSDSISEVVTAVGRCNVGVRTINKIDVSDYNSLAINLSQYSKTGGNTTAYLTLCSATTWDEGTTLPLKQLIASDGEIIGDVSSITGEYYVVVWCQDGSYSTDLGTVNMTFDKIWLE